LAYRVQIEATLGGPGTEHIVMPIPYLHHFKEFLMGSVDLVILRRGFFDDEIAPTRTETNKNRVPLRNGQKKSPKRG
jgi:hypothetical protein